MSRIWILAGAAAVLTALLVLLAQDPGGSPAEPAGGAAPDLADDIGVAPLATAPPTEPEAAPRPDSGPTAAQRTALTETAAIEGGRVILVVDDDRIPLPGAEVGIVEEAELERRADEVAALLEAGHHRDELPLLVGTVVAADASGRALVPRPAERAVAAGRADGWFGDRRVAPFGERELELKLRAAPSLSVRVVDAAGAPAAGVEVWMALGEFRGPDSAERPPEPGQWGTLGTTDARGIARVTPAAARALDGATVFAAVHGVLADREFPLLQLGGERQSEPVLALPACAPLAVRVTSADGAPVAGATVRLTSPAAFERDGYQECGVVPVETDGEGRATAPLVQLGAEVEVRVQHPAGGTSLVEVVVHEGGPVEVALPDTDLVVTGRLLDEDGRPVTPAVAEDRGVTWYAVARNAAGRATSRKSAQLEADGAFELRWKPHDSGPWTEVVLHAQANEPSGFAERSVAAPPGGAGRVDAGSLALAGGVPLARGRVVDGADRPLAGAKVFATLPETARYTYVPRTHGSNVFPAAETGEDGAFEVRGPAGLAVVDLLASHAHRESAVLVEDVGVGATDVVVVLRAEVVVVGRLVAEPAVLASFGWSTRVSLLRDDGARFNANLDPDGTFEFGSGFTLGGRSGGAEVGVYRLLVGPSGVEPLAAVDGVEVARPERGGQCDLGEVSIAGLVPVSSIRVVDTEGRPVVAVFGVWAHGEGQGSSFLTADEPGRLRYPDFGRGVDLAVFAGGYLPQRLEGVTGDREVTLERGPEVVLHWPDFPAVREGVHVVPHLEPARPDPGPRAGSPPTAAFDATGTARLHAEFSGEAIVSLTVMDGERHDWRFGQLAPDERPRITIPAEGTTEPIVVRFPASIAEYLAEEYR